MSALIVTSCRGCRFFVGAAGRPGACRRHAPAPAGAAAVDPETWTVGNVAWPRVLPDWWCGDFEGRPGPAGGTTR